MDKRMFSNFGWMIIVTITLTVILALTSPLGKYVGKSMFATYDANKNVAEEMVNEDRVENLGDDFNDKFTECHHVNSTVVNTTQCYSGDTVCTKCSKLLKKGVYNHGESKNIKYKAPTCLNVGYTGDDVCERCASLIKKGSSIPALGHDYNENAYYSVNATYHQTDCRRGCGVPKKVNHSYTTSTKENPTCTVLGVRHYDCNACEYQYDSREIEALGHTFDKQSTPTATYLKSSATCQAKAVYYKKCIRCSEKNSETYEYGSVAAHNYNNKTVSSTYLKSAATCTAKAQYYYKCQWCSAKGTSTYENGSANGHTSTYGGTSGVHTKCSVCSATLSSSHSYTVDSGVQYTAATCVVKRKNYLKCACGYNPQSSSYVVETGSVSGHTSTYGGTSGVHTKCSVCGTTLEDGTKHSYTVDSGVQYTAATCTAKRKNYKKCACGYNPQSSSYVVETGSVGSHSTSTRTVYNYACTQQATQTYCTRSGCSYSSTGSYSKNTHSHSFTTVCTTSHKHGKTCSALGWGCSSHGLSSSSTPNSTACNFRHLSCTGCKVNYYIRVCYTYYNKTKYPNTMSCKCAHSTKQWRCSDDWCRSKYNSSGAYETQSAW